MKNELIVNCPTCNKIVVWADASIYRPFCSKRCQLIDLGEWAEEKHKISGQSLEEDLSMMDEFEIAETYDLLNDQISIDENI